MKKISKYIAIFCVGFVSCHLLNVAKSHTQKNSVLLSYRGVSHTFKNISENDKIKLTLYVDRTSDFQSVNNKADNFLKIFEYKERDKNNG